ncbi:MAG: YhbY family RNA-binding protein [Lachnospiraceae bacterium]|nr:YhbY family RNA-binding protein [Lachnospiraceae bacterium]
MLTSKQRAYLIGLSNHLTPVVSIGKNGVSPETVISTEEAFNTQELIKGTVQKTAPELPEEAARTLAERTRAQLVKVIGRKFILYRPFKDKPVIELPAPARAAGAGSMKETGR